jgi:anti-anti-sigma factor
MTAVTGVSVIGYGAADAFVIALEGEHDMTTTSLLSEQASHWRPESTVAVVDLSRATFIDCSVVNWLVRACEAAGGARQGRLRIVQGPPNGMVERVFDLIQLHEQFPCFRTRGEALAEPAPGSGEAHLTST